MNLKNETMEMLREHGKTEKDVVWTGTDTEEISIELFWKYADNGAEWWEYKQLPERPKEKADSNIIFDFDFFD